MSHTAYICFCRFIEIMYYIKYKLNQEARAEFEAKWFEYIDQKGFNSTHNPQFCTGFGLMV